ncbi:MAG: hypothetical protein ACJ0GU_00995 [Gammaproteobacteria bacterium]|nr:hypothetical protein [Gammaproteobacteria bacterium]RZO96376.1 MAG: hypothetical protein EVA53_03965 [Gammaproteobacteria bacterium]|tara:strand:+ start:2786 stop:3274 length:489 start_codon:yes stop_codon:yes gene_type:complete
MNIFYLNRDPKIAAIEHSDKHCVKMILEYAQMLCTAHRELDGDEIADKLFMYKRTHLNHPSTVWTRENKKHYDWLYDLFAALCEEYTYRYSKVHNSDLKFRDILKISPKKIPNNKAFKQPPQCMPDKYKCKDSIIAYQKFYLGEKAHFSKWKKREVPKWFKC